MIDFNFITQENLELVESIANTKGRNEKTDLAKKYLSNPEFVELVRATYNPFKQYKIKKIKPLALPVKDPESVKYFLEHMSCKDAASNEDIAQAAKITQALGSIDLALLFLNVLKKDLKMGINIKSLNEAGYDIPVFLIQLAQPQSHLDKFLEENPDEFGIQTKYDGNRSVLYVDDLEFISRGGHKIESCDFLLQQVDVDLGDTILDGEILHESLNLQKAQSIISRKDSNHGRGHELTYQVFDVWKWKGQDVKHLPLIERMNLIKGLPENDYIVCAPFMVWNRSMGDPRAYITKLYQEAIEAGHEGLILKNLSSPYEGKRSRNWVKMKEHETIDAEIIAVNPGEVGKGFENTMGSATGLLNGKEFNIGGWSAKERDFYFNNPNELISKTVECEIWKLSPDGIPLHARRKRIREDK